MPVDPAFQHTWPVYQRTYRTTSDPPVTTVLAEVPNAGDVVAIPELYVCGRTEDGFLGDIQLGGYTLVNSRGGAQLFTETEAKSVIGAGGLIVVVRLSGSELIVETTGQPEVNVLWGIYWRAVEFPAP